LSSTPRFLLPLYALIFLQSVVYVALVPLAPTFAERLALSEVETGALLAAGSFATVLVALPIGLLSDRAGARALTLASAILFTLSSLGQGLAADFWSLLLSRVAFGVAFGAVWTAGLAWLAEGMHGFGAGPLGASVAVSGAAFAVGPAFAGLLGDALGAEVPFLVCAGLGGAVTAVLARSRPSPPPLAPGPTLSGLRGSRHLLLRASLALMAVLGFVAGGVNLLVPLQLRAGGLSAGQIGLAFSAASLLFTLVSGLVARLGARAVTLRTAGLAALAYGLCFLLVIGSASSAAALAFVFLRTPPWATLDTIVYSLGALGAHRAALGRGTAMGLLNLAWGASATAGPLLAGAVAEAGGARSSYLLLLALALAVAFWVLARRTGEAASAACGSGESLATIPRRKRRRAEVE
jgi:MFS family permease